MTVFDHDDYIEFLNDWIVQQPKGGRGLKGQIAKELGISSTLVSFLFSGEKYFTMEQASSFADYIGFDDSEANYFLTLVELKRAGNSSLKNRLTRKKNQEKKEGKRVANRVKKDLELNDEESAQYYSSWTYCGIRNLVSLTDIQTSEDISKRLDLPPSTVNKVIQFLLKTNLIVKAPGGFEVGPAYSYINDESPHVNKHRQNWRVRAMKEMDSVQDRNLFYTCPMSISEEDSEKVYSLLADLIVKTVDIIKPSPSEVVRCLNIDWFKY